MCNDCECAFEYLCSIKGHMPFGSCCEKCIGYDKEHSCSSYQVNIAKVEVESVEYFEPLPEKTIKLYP